MIALYFVVSLALVTSTRAQTGPNFCTYSEGVFECDYASMVSTSDRPIDYYGFSEDPQQIELTVNGFLPYFGDSKVFTNFESIDTSTFDSNSPSTLTIDCGWAGSMFMTAGAFSNMSHVQYLKIRNCETYYIPSQMFQELVNLDYFSFEGGSIDDIDPNGMFGLSVEKLTFSTHSFPRNIGRFDLKYTPFSTRAVPPGLLFNWKNLSTVAIVGADLDTVSADVFTFNTKLTHIDLSDNTMTSIPSGLFDNLNSLSEVAMYNIEWTCSCDNTWFVEYTTTNNISMFGDYMCSNIAGTSVWKYYNDNCLTDNLCEGTIAFIPETDSLLNDVATAIKQSTRPDDISRRILKERLSTVKNLNRFIQEGVAVLGKCLSLFAMIAYGCALFAIVIVVVSLVVIIKIRKDAMQKKTRKVNAVRRWNKVLDAGLRLKGGKM